MSTALTERGRNVVVVDFPEDVISESELVGLAAKGTRVTLQGRVVAADEPTGKPLLTAVERLYWVPTVSADGFGWGVWRGWGSEG